MANSRLNGMDNKGTSRTPPLPKSGGESLEKSGVMDTGYLDQKGTPDGISAMFNYLPPGENIEDQDCADIRPMKLKNWTGGLSYPDDGAF